MILATHGILAKGGVITYDTDALAFFTATGITDTTQKIAVNQLVLDLKSYGIWTKMRALYPFAGGTATTHKYNLKDPRDLDVAFRIVWNGGVTHSLTGVTFNGTTGYGDTKLNPYNGGVGSNIMPFNSSHISIYPRTIALSVSDMADMGAFELGGEPCMDIYMKTSTNIISDQYGYTANRISRTVTNNLGLNIDTRTNSITHKLFIKGVQQGATDTNANNQSRFPNIPLYIGALNYANGNKGNYSTREYAFASIGEGLTDTDVTNFTTAVNTYQTALSRNV